MHSLTCVDEIIDRIYHCFQRIHRKLCIVERHVTAQQNLWRDGQLAVDAGLLL